MVAVADKPSLPQRRVRSAAIPVFVRLKARNLYLSQGLSHKAISEATGLRVETLVRLAHREGWTALRKQQKTRLLKEADTQAQAMESEVLESVVGLAGQHALQGLSRTGEALERTDRDAARDFQSYTSGVKNLVSIMRDIRQPDAAAPDGARLNVFVLRVGDAVQPARAVQQVQSVNAVTTPQLQQAQPVDVASTPIQ